MDAGAAPGDFAARVIAWQRVHGRHDLPWQNTRDAYRIWVSEIMLQQTQVAAVIGYYARFLERFPDVASLAAASDEDVMRQWSGLGYYSRARNLHRAAKVVVGEFGGDFPMTRDALQALPGIGRSTAAAIAAFAFGGHAAILDGNVKRVFARHFCVEGYPGSPAIETALWRRAESLLPARDVETYTQGLMDLGATLCTRARPRCATCPLATSCGARAGGRTAELPHRKPRAPLPRRSCVMLVVLDSATVLLERRPPAGIWGGLWCLPQADDMASARALAERLGVDWPGRRTLPAIAHGFTHYHLAIAPVLLHAARLPRSATGVEEPGRVWLPLSDAHGAALPAPVKKLLASLAGESVFAAG